MQKFRSKIPKKGDEKREISSEGKGQAYKTGLLPLNAVSRCSNMSADAVSLSTEFDIFAHKLVQSSILEPTDSIYKPIGGSERFGIFNTCVE